MSSILSGLGFRFGQRAACSKRFVTPCQSEVDDDVPLVVDKGTEPHSRLMDTSLSRPASPADIRQNMTGQQRGAKKVKMPQECEPPYRNFRVESLFSFL